MILYYAMGGGLGHLSRSLAILQELPQSLMKQVRLLASSRHAELVIPSATCPLDIVAGDILTSRRKYLGFLEDYLERYRIDALVLDSFPFGIIGEWLDVGLSLPRVLIARSLKWDAYQERIHHRDGQFPQHALVIERLSAPYWKRLRQASRISRLDAPITLREWEESLLWAGLLDSRDDALRRSRTPSTLRVEWTQSVRDGVPTRSVGTSKLLSQTLIIHSGDERERQVLRQIAGQEGLPEETTDEIFPEHGIYPAENVIAHYKTIVSAAGYNMVAIAGQAPPDQNFILHPFPRRFDEQFLRLEHFRHDQQRLRQQASPELVEGKTCGRERAARWLAELLSFGNVVA